MKRLHIFNPSHDEALAANSPFYYPAKAARTLGTDLATLPAWWAGEGDGVLLPEETALPLDFPKKGIEFVHLSDLQKRGGQELEAICPWGWDPLLAHQLQKAGIAPHLLPTPGQLEKIRQLSSRETAVKVLEAVRKDLPDTIGTSYLCHSEEEVWHLAEIHQQLMLKAPWSSSGRGVFPATAQPAESLRKRVSRILKEQGCIEAEPLYNRLQDFALEFEASAQEVRYKGLSLFATTDNGAYTGNIIAPEEVLRQHLPEATAQMLPTVAKVLSQHLHEAIGPHYEGPLGVDLMLVKTEQQGIALHPCVEINLRNTMGHAAIALRPLLPPQTTGIYTLRHVGTHPAGTRCLTPGARQTEALLIAENQGF